MDRQKTYKRVNINWLFVVGLGIIHLLVIILYIYQLGNNPITKSGIIKVSIMCTLCYIYAGRIKLIIDENYVKFRSDFRIFDKIPICTIKNISVKQAPRFDKYMIFQGDNFKHLPYDYFVKQAVIIKLKNGKIYQIAIKDAERIKDEIEKRMTTINND